MKVRLVKQILKMTGRISGISKRHFRRLVRREVQNMSSSKFADKSRPQSINENEEAQSYSHFADNSMPENPSDNQNNSENAEVPIFQNVNNPDMTPDFVKNSDKNYNYLDDLRDWCVRHRITRDASDELLRILQKTGLYVPSSTKTLLEFESNRISPVSIRPGEYLHFGLKNSLSFLNLTLPENCNSLEIDVGIDGLPLFKSSGKMLWPILGAIANSNHIRPFLIGAYVGVKKPDMVNEYLAEFVNEIKELNVEGLLINERKITPKIRCFICDTPARAYVTGTVGHTSADGCSKCKQKARRINKRLSFECSVATSRTDDDFKNRACKPYHNQFFQEHAHILEDINIKMQSQFPLDTMHLIDLGVAKKMLSSIWHGRHNGSKLTAEQKQQFDTKLIEIAPYIPKEFGRKPRTMRELCRWKAIEFRQFFLYYGIVLLKNVLDEDMYAHFLLLHSAYRLLSCPRNCQKNLSCTQELLEVFVHNFKHIYGEDKISYNIHSLLHITECVRMYGTVDNFSAYRFENFLQALKKDVRQPTRILQQLHNRNLERNKMKSQPKKVGLGKLLPQKYQKTASPLYMNYYCNMFYLSSKQPDNHCYLTGNIPLKIVSFFTDSNGQDHIFAYKFSQIEPFFVEPLDSRKALGIIFAKGLCENEQVFKVADIACKLVCLPFESGFILIPIQHHLSS